MFRRLWGIPWGFFIAVSLFLPLFGGRPVLAEVQGELEGRRSAWEEPEGYGSWVDWSGDYDGDGEPDLAVGSWGFEGPSPTAVEVIFSAGGVVRLPGFQLGDGFGVYAGSVGDVDGDGRDDLAVGAPYGMGNARIRSGVLYVYSGVDLSGPAPAPLFSISGAVEGDRLGWSACAIGDIDGDGFGDIAVGAPYGDYLAGEVHLVGGGPAPRWRRTLQNDAIFKGQLGSCVASVGDLDGDGQVDLAVGVPLKRIWQGGDPRLPEVWVYLGKDLGSDSSSPSYRLFGADWNRLFGWSIVGVGDVNGDGFDDLAVGAPRKRASPPFVTPDGPQTQGVDPGKVWVYGGGTQPETEAFWILTGENPDDTFGNAIGGTGDVDGDGFADLVVGAPEHDGAGSNSGAVYFFRGGAVPDTTADLVHRSGQPGARLGYSLSVRRSGQEAGSRRLVAGAIDGGWIALYRLSVAGSPENAKPSYDEGLSQSGP